MKNVKFRGKSKENGKWVIGYLVRDIYNYPIIIQKMKMASNMDTYFIFNVSGFYVDEKTLGQYTRSKDKNNKEIYTGDIVLMQTFKDFKKVGVVEWIDDCFKITWLVKLSGLNRNDEFLIADDEKIAKWRKTIKIFEQNYLSKEIDKCCVIGNIYDNPELIGGKNG